MLQITFSNHFERLEHALLESLARPPASPFDADEIIVPSAALRRRIELATADRYGVCSNIHFSFLAQWLWRQIGRVIPVSEMSPFTTPVMAWRVLAILGDAAFVAKHPPLERYLRHADSVMRYELAARIAGLFEHYLTYRPDWLASWLDGRPAGVEHLDAARAEDERWQAALWHRIASALGTDRRHPSIAFFEAIKRMGSDVLAHTGLPARTHMFCLPTTPPLYLEILNGLAQWVDLRLYVLNPCREYWFELVDSKRLAYLAASGRADHHEVGNRLLSAWGRQTQANIDLLLEHERTATVEEADFQANGGATLLVRLQNAILEMVDLERGSVVMDADDRSLEIHVCHSLTRELEVLQDQLLPLFARERPLRPSEVLVAVPDLEAATPLIDAVFGNVPKERQIPYVITGRPVSARNVCAHALLSVLTVATSRFHASAVFDLLQQPIIARRFGVGVPELETVHAWIRDAGIRWGLDGAHRAELELPSMERHTFQDGLDRLFLGYALPADTTTPLDERLAAGNAEGSAAQALGSFSAFIRELRRLRETVCRPQTPDEWRGTLLDIMARFIAPLGDETEDARELSVGIHELHTNMGRGGYGEALPVDVVRVALQSVLDDPVRGGVPSGAVTFAAIASLRNLPYRHVCVLGLNDGAFPSSQRPNEFDLMALAPRRGDRQRRVDDRNVFLDLMLAARERLYLSYTGRSVRDNAPLPPSVLVSELLDYCSAAIEQPPFTETANNSARARLVIEHPLQAFSLDYFKPDADPRCRSFHDEYCQALKHRLTASTAPAAATAVSRAPTTESDESDEVVWEPKRPFFSAPLAKAGPEFQEVSLDRLVRFFRNPCKELLRTRLAIELPKGDEELQDDEPFVPDWPARDALAARVLPRLLKGDSLEVVRSFAAAGIEYPIGCLGERELDLELERLSRFAQSLAPLLASPALDPVSATCAFVIDGEPWRLTGGFGDLRAEGLVRYRYDDARATDYLTGWLHHLFLNAIELEGAERSTAWYSRDGHYVLPPILSASDLLATLVGLYRAGLDRPLHFFPKSAWAYVTNDHSLAKAASAWESTRFRPYGEDRDPAYRLALRGVDDPLDDAFAECATAVFGPLLDIIQDDRLRPVA